MLGGINPWLSMWTEPRLTIRTIVSTNPRFGIIYLSAIYVLQSFFYAFSSLHLNSYQHLVLGLSILLSPILGFIWLYCSGAVLYLVGRCLGGKASFSYLLAVTAWSKIPMSIALLMWFVLLVASQGLDLLYYPPGAESIFIILIACILIVWSGVLIFQSIREIQGFSVGKTFLNLIFLDIFIYSIIFYFAL